MTRAVEELEGCIDPQLNEDEAIVPDCLGGLVIVPGGIAQHMLRDNERRQEQSPALQHDPVPYGRWPWFHWIDYLLYHGKKYWTKPKIEKHSVVQAVQCVAIGVHGWAPLGGAFQPSLGRDSSAQMSNLMSDAFRRMLGDNVEIVQIPLTGHGTVEDRVNKHWTHQLASYREAIERADVIAVASHSQGAAVATILLAKLIEENWVRPSAAKVGFLSMAGVFAGPFPDLPSDLYASTQELFLLSQPFTSVSRLVEDSMSYLLENRVRVLAIAAYRDAVVPLFSATLHAFPPNPMLLRGIFYMPTHRPDQEEVSTDPIYHMERFFGQLIALCLLLRNLGAFNDLLVHISGFIRGSLFDNLNAHSSIRNNVEIYSLAAQWFLAQESKEMEDGSVAAIPKRQRGIARMSGALCAQLLTDSFYYSELNGYFLKIRLSELMDQCEKLGLHQYVNEIGRAFALWAPTSSQHRQLRSMLQPAIERERAILGSRL